MSSLDPDFECTCDLGAKCDGNGTVRCRHCGGSRCTCPCGGTTECVGCLACYDEPLFDEAEEP